MSPTDDINFGYQQIFSTKKEMIEIKNTGKFPFSYVITYLKSEEQKTHNKQNNDKDRINKANKSNKGSKKDSSKKSKASKDNKMYLPLYNMFI